MLDMSMQVLEVVIQNSQKTPEEILAALGRAFPQLPLDALKGYVFELGRKKYLSILPGDDGFSSISVNPIAYVALEEARTALQHFTPPMQHIQFGNVNGNIVTGNQGGSYTLNATNTFTQAMDASLRDVLSSVDAHAVDPAEREDIKKLLSEILAAVEKSESAPQGILERINAYMQKHAWLASPLAVTALRWLCG